MAIWVSCTLARSGYNCRDRATLRARRVYPPGKAFDLPLCTYACNEQPLPGFHACLVGTSRHPALTWHTLQHANGDSIEYAWPSNRRTGELLLDPYHPLLHPGGLLFYRCGHLSQPRWTGRALLPLQVFTALAGGLCAGC